MSANSLMNASRRRRAVAAIWATRLHGGLSPYERSRYEVWRADPANQRALLEAQHVWEAMSASLALRVRARKTRVQRVAAALGGVAVIAALVATLSHRWDPPIPQTASVQILHSQGKVIDRYELADRSLVSLRPGTSLRFEMSDAERCAHVPGGEIFFDVAKDPRPFVVDTGSGSIRAVGTRFAVRQYDGPPLVVVEEGTVNVKRADGDDGVSVMAGQQLSIVRNGDLIVRSVDVKKELAWTRKLLSVSGMTVGEAIAEFNRRNRVQIKIVDDGLAREVLNLGDFDLDEPEFFVESLALQGNVVVERIDPYTLRLLTASGPDQGGR
jgi:transmembrane sensor